MYDGTRYRRLGVGNASGRTPHERAAAYRFGEYLSVAYARHSATGNQTGHESRLRVTTGNALIEQKISGSDSKADMPMAAVASLQVDGGSSRGSLAARQQQGYPPGPRQTQ